MTDYSHYQHLLFTLSRPRHFAHHYQPPGGLQCPDERAAALGAVARVARYR